MLGRESRGFRPPAGMIDKAKFMALEERVAVLERLAGIKTPQVVEMPGEAPPVVVLPQDPRPEAMPMLNNLESEAVDTADKAALVAEALELKVPGTDGKPAAESILKRWSVFRLEAAIAAAKA